MSFWWRCCAAVRKQKGSDNAHASTGAMTSIYFFGALYLKRLEQQNSEAGTSNLIEIVMIY